jgi:hypothetical protein
VSVFVAGRAEKSICGFQRAPALMEALRPHVA